MLFDNLLPAHIMEKAGWNPACTTVNPAIDLSGGPFRIAKVSAQRIVLRANPKWWGTKPNSRRITVDIASTSTQLAQWVRSGQVQVALPTDLTPAFLVQMTSLPNVQSQIALSSTILELEMASGPDSRLSTDMRLAIALSVDRQAVVTQQANWALSSVQVAASHIYAQGESGYHATPSTTPTTTPPTPTTPTSTSTTVVGQGGSVNFPVTPSPTQASALMVASGYSRAGTGTWHSDFAVPLTLKLAVDESDPWAASTAPQLQSQLEGAGFTVSLIPAGSGAAAGALLSGGSADLALIPRTTTPFLSETPGLVLGPARVAGPERVAELDQLRQRHLRQPGHAGLRAAELAPDHARLPGGRHAAVGRRRRSPALHRADGADLQPQDRQRDRDAHQRQPAVVRPVLGRTRCGVHGQHHPVPAGALRIHPATPAGPRRAIGHALRSRGAPRSGRPVGVAE